MFVFQKQHTMQPRYCALHTKLYEKEIKMKLKLSCKQIYDSVMTMKTYINHFVTENGQYI